MNNERWTDLLNEECGSDHDNDDDCIEVNVRSKTAFAELKLTMEKLPIANIYKKLIKSGVGDVLGVRTARVQWSYDAFTENETKPYDTSHKINVDHITTMYHEMHTGVWLSLETMQKGEVAEFIIDHSLMFGSVGFAPRIKQKADILLIVKLIDFTIIAEDVERQTESHGNQRKFSNVKEKVTEMREKAMALKRCERFNNACRILLRAVQMLELSHLANEIEQHEQKTMLIQYYTEIMMIYSQANEHRKVCVMINELRRLKNINGDVDILVYEAVALSHIEENGRRSIEILERCERIQPGNQLISHTKKTIEAKFKKYENDMKDIWQKAMQYNGQK